VPFYQVEIPRKLSAPMGTICLNLTTSSANKTVLKKDPADPCVAIDTPQMFRSSIEDT
jgi:hypothetical protein